MRGVSSAGGFAVIFFIWGWGRQAKEIVVDPHRRLVLSYRYLHLFYGLKLSWGAKYHDAVWTGRGWEVEPASKAEAAFLAGGVAPEIPWWDRFSLLGLGFLCGGLPIVVAISVALVS